MSFDNTPDELDANGIVAELGRRASLARWKFTFTEDAFFTKLNDDEFKTIYVEEKDWKPNVQGNSPELGRRYRGWQEEMLRTYNALSGQYGSDYEEKVTEAIKDWDAATAARELNTNEAHAARLLEASKSNEWKLRE
ncbi:hypothetical protein [Roseimicrobium sp. ORNL1]|uniref:hypothetical protein n=1 Tax=Roseimicrobium sp. ORNL1 TaxID=2711231 RepID=UPI0013E16E98|nr:hypothetical protein [Roseimicrobium sp. ORNL1]QIF01910.1 hypothetical protein G5S37_10345 [Roseimicrobium sp. ORNL1]